MTANKIASFSLCVTFCFVPDYKGRKATTA